MSDEMHETVSKVKKKADDSYALLSGLLSSHEMLKDKVNDLSYDLCTKISLGQHQESNGKMSTAIEDIKKEAHSQRDQKDAINAKIRSVEADIKDLKNALREILCDQYDLKKSISEVDKKIRPAVDEVFSTMHQNIATAKKYVIDKVDALVIPNDTVSMTDVKTQIEAQIEPAWLDARNALLTAKNHEIRISILEKKIENALLQLKNYEFAK